MMDKQAYEALHNGVAFQIRADAGLLMVEDADRVDFLHRMTTNNIARLTSGHATITVLPSPTARVLYAFGVMAFDDKLYCLPAPGQTEALRKHLRSQIFFMDKVKVTDLSSDLKRVHLMGPKAASLLQSTLLNDVDLGKATDGAFFEAGGGSNGGIYVIKQLHYDVPGYEVMVPAEALDALVQSWVDAGAVPLTDDAAYTTRRIEVGQPAAAHELVDEYNPLEVGLQWTCADNKGCYTGQEIIARQITYDKITKTLVGLQAASPFTVGDDVLVDGRKAGTVTSAAHSPQLDAYVGLAVLKRPQNVPGTQVQIGDQAGEVKALPMA